MQHSNIKCMAVSSASSQNRHFVLTTVAPILFRCVRVLQCPDMRPTAFLASDLERFRTSPANWGDDKGTILFPSLFPVELSQCLLCFAAIHCFITVFTVAGGTLQEFLLANRLAAPSFASKSAASFHSCSLNTYSIQY